MKRNILGLGLINAWFLLNGLVLTVGLLLWIKPAANAEVLTSANIAASGARRTEDALQQLTSAYNISKDNPLFSVMDMVERRPETLVYVDHMYEEMIIRGAPVPRGYENHGKNDIVTWHDIPISQISRIEITSSHPRRIHVVTRKPILAILVSLVYGLIFLLATFKIFSKNQRGWRPTLLSITLFGIVPYIVWWPWISAVGQFIGLRRPYMIMCGTIFLISTFVFAYLLTVDGEQAGTS